MPTSDEHRADLWRLYNVAVEEYRFNVNLGNQRFQWYVGLNFAATTVAAGLLRLGDGTTDREISAVVFGAGLLLAVYTWAITYRQATYYRNAREAVKKIAAELGVSEWSVQTTDGFGAPAHRLVPQVRTINYLLLATLAVMHACGAVYVLTTS